MPSLKNLNQSPIIDQIQTKAREWLDDVDSFALASVQNGVGGPFGAALFLYNAKSGASEMIGEPRGNAVLSTGCGSAHAEDRILGADTMEKLSARLKELADDRDNLYVVMVSSAESCPACHTKEQIVARELDYMGLLPLGHFIVFFGATYKDTAEVAGFHDAPYFEDIGLGIGEGLIKVTPKHSDELNDAVRILFRGSPDPVSAVVRDGHILAVSADHRCKDALFASADYTAIQMAAKDQKDKNILQPWNLREATLYTSSLEVGPLAYTECQWANITRIIPVKDARSRTANDAKNISNDVLGQVVGTVGYNHPQSAVVMVHLDGFANKAQNGWRERMEKLGNSILYNGINAA